MISPERLLSLTSGKAAFAARGSVAKTPYFPETISCLAVIMGESGDSGHNLVLVDNRRYGKSRAASERFPTDLLRCSQIRDRGRKYAIPATNRTFSLALILKPKRFRDYSFLAREPFFLDYSSMD